MKWTCNLAGGALLATVMNLATAADLTAGDPTRVTIRLGSETGEHLFAPDHLVFETGKLYALRIVNAGSVHYYFGSQGMADAVYTRKVVALDKSGQDTV